jgi:transketolase
LGVTLPWKAITGTGGLEIGVDIFGASAPAEKLAEEYGVTPKQVAAKVQGWLKAL